MVDNIREPQAFNSSELSAGLGCKPLEEATDLEWLKKTCAELWQIIDDIDTYGDMAKENDKLFRELVERRQKDRWKTGMTSDGYLLLAP